ncbi:MAG: protein kinase, partial [Sandaracinaceae bacterium]
MLLFTDRFEPRRILGEGALGSVEVAFDRAREREVALKRVRLRDPLHADVFQRELRLLRGVAHPRLVRLLDAGIADDEAGRFGYFTSELTIGTPLATPRAWSTLRATLIDTAHALLALHDASLMHGDVSAANVLVDASGRATLIDLGCARPLGEPLVTLDGTHPAPEILRGARASIAIDLFALGATFAPHLPSDTPAPIVQLIGSLRAPSERDRPTDLREVLERLGEEPPRRAATRAPLIGRDAAVRGFAQHLDRIERGVAGPRVVAIEAAPGLGTTRLLEELRWTAQLKMPVDEATGPTLGRVDRLLARIGADDLPAWLARARADGSSFALFIDELDRATPKERARALQLARALGDDDPWTLVVGGTVPREIAAERWPLAPLTNDEVARWIGPDVSAERRARIVDVTAGIPSEIERVLARPDLDPQHALSTASGTTGALDGLSPALRRALIEIACGGSIDAPELAHALTQLGWLRYEGGAHRLARPSDAARIEAAASPAERTDAHRALASRTSGASALLHLARAGDVDAAHEGLERIAAETTDRSSLGPLARALAELRPSLLAAEVLEEASEAGLAIRTLARLRRGASPETVDALRLRAGSCRLALGSPSGALRHLRRAAESQTPAVRDRAVERIAEALLRKGAHRSAADRLRAIERPSADAEALLGVALSYLGEHEESAALLARAARRDLSPRSRLRAVSFLAIDAYRRGALRDAAEGYREAYAIARAHHQEEQLPQTALNVATIEHRLGELGAALTRYSEALAWARAFAQPVTELTLRLNRARLHADLGLFDRARTALGQLAPRLQAEQLDFLAADAAGLDAEIAWMTGEGDAASAERAASEFEALGAEREAADARLLAGHCAMNR